MTDPRTVLIVDDSESVAKHLTRILEGSGRYSVVGHATNGLDAVKMFIAKSPQLVCLDIVMPMTDGMEVLRLLRGINANAKIVMISSIGGVADVVERCLEAGATNVIAKPWDEPKVLEILDRITGALGSK